MSVSKCSESSVASRAKSSENSLSMSTNIEFGGEYPSILIRVCLSVVEQVICGSGVE